MQYLRNFFVLCKTALLILNKQLRTHEKGNFLCDQYIVFSIKEIFAFFTIIY